jgi:glycosyltransferase involved in cell wall biosynthesis
VSFVIPGAPIPAGLDAGPNVSFPGYVPDTRTCYTRPDTIVVAPLFSGTGQRVKLLEAFAMACPVVTTSIGAKGFPICDGEQAILAHTAHDFETGLRRLAASRERRVAMGKRGREMILSGFTWKTIAEKIGNVVEEAVAAR